MARLILPLPLLAAMPAAAQGLGVIEGSPDHLRRYTECMNLARAEPLKALPAAEKWHSQGGSLAARHCVATAMFGAGRYLQAAAQFESIARDMGKDRPGLRAELWVQAGQAFMEAGSADKAAEAQSRALELKTDDAELWLDRALSYAAMQLWPRAISDFDRALTLRPNDVELLVLRAAAWRNAGNPVRATEDASRALKIAPDHSEALLERGFAALARGDRGQANSDFNMVLRLVPPGSSASRRAEAGLRGELPTASTPTPPAGPRTDGSKTGGKR
ncbi:MAG: tetratricopeptide repeat protein [Alphaproteobacteria bacterium]|nr:tetratricopeptide repeat protein [Alphaproteobacteria bacterium]